MTIQEINEGIQRRWRELDRQMKYLKSIGIVIEPLNKKSHEIKTGNAGNQRNEFPE
jgi:hypothetical protein